MSTATRQAWTEKIARDALKAKQPKSKYHNRKVSYEGLEFDSRAEFNTWRDLELQQRAGQITELRRQVPIVLWAFAQAGRQAGDAIEVAEFVADFTFKRDGVYVVADRKSAMTKRLPVYRLKRAIFRANYGFDITEIL